MILVGYGFIEFLVPGARSGTRQFFQHPCAWTHSLHWECSSNQNSLALVGVLDSDLE